MTFWTEALRNEGIPLSRGSSDYNRAMANWWDGYPEQRYWMEQVRRDDFGDELFAPRGRNWGRENVQYVEPGDVVMHWRRGRGFVASSVAAGAPSIQDREWEGRVQKSWVVPLAEFEPLPHSVSLAELQAVDDQIMGVKDLLMLAYSDFKAFPFARKPTYSFRPLQAYLVKFPIELFEVTALVGLELPTAFSPLTGQALPRPHSGGGPRYLSDTKLRQGIERHSVQMTRRWYERRGATDIRELGKPYDLELTLQDKVRHIEVKGSVMPAISSVLLTRNEVAHARSYRETDLVVVDSIEYDREGDEFTFSGGVLRRWEGWVPEDRHIRGMQFDYELQPLV